MDRLELVARALAHADGHDPEATSNLHRIADFQAIMQGVVSRPLWRDYEPEARRMIAVLAALEIIPAPPE